MSSRKRKPDDLRALCAHQYPDDGVDPRDDKRRDAKYETKTDWKLRQLCKQVQRALQMSLGSLPQADGLAGAFVKEVTPAPNAGRLCVVIAVTDPGCQTSVAEILRQGSGRLRADVASAITRRRTPELTYEVIVEDVHHD